MRKIASEWAKASAASEFEEAQLGDVRRTRRLQGIAQMAAAKPDAGFPQLVNNDSELEGLYRFLSNPHVSAEAILEPHIEATMARAREAKRVLMIHDTTDFTFGGKTEREGLGPVHGAQQGFLAHVALVLLPGEARIPLGIGGLVRVVRDKTTKKQSSKSQPKSPSESQRWEQLVRQTEARSEGVECLHVMDREGDAYELLGAMLDVDARFIVRAAHNRALLDAEAGKLKPELEQLVPVASRTIQLSVRPDKARSAKSLRKHPARQARSAEVAVAGWRVTLRRPVSAHHSRPEVSVNVVYVWEPSPPADQPAVSWVLYTTEPVLTAEQLWTVVDHYRARWTIEELFKALKTGCNIEKRQIESLHGLANTLSLFLPIACKMLLARSLVRAAPHAPAHQILPAVLLILLQQHLRLTAPLQTAEQALFAIAKLGGHLRRNGAPGWQTLARGLEALLWMHAGWRVANVQRSDQS